MTKTRRVTSWQAMNLAFILSNVSSICTTLFVVISYCVCEGGPITPSPLQSDYLNRQDLSQSQAHNGLQVSSQNSPFTEEIRETTVFPFARPTTGSTTLPKVSSPSSPLDFMSKSYNSAKTMISSYSTSLPIYMARCRATCLQKFQVATTTPPDATVSGSGDYSDTKINEMHLLPILRSKRSTSNPVKSCNQSSNCLMCWKSCKLIQTQEFSVLLTGNKFTHPKLFGEKKKTKKYWKGESPEGSQSKQQSILPCSLNKHCMAGCQVACSFYHRLSLEISRDAFSSVRLPPSMNRSSVVHITAGKFKWPRSQMSPTSPVVYVVIQEYPDRKWRQIAQTTETEIDIPQELSTPAEREQCTVFVVGPSGVQSILSYNKNKSVPVKNTQEIAENRGKVSKTLDTSISPTVEIQAEELTTQPSYIPLELQLVSLSHQRSLVIAEIKWEESESDTKVEYLVTWELSRGGLKGHLVTDSNSVTLSLWPDTSYEIQVELFQVNIDTDGDVTLQPPTSFRKSVPLIVNTSTASFPVDHPSALLITSDADDYPHQQYNSIEYQHGTFIYRMLSVGIVSLVCSIVLLTLIAFTWSKFKLCECQRCSSVCFSGGKNDRLLEADDNTPSSHENKSCAPSIAVISETVSSPLTHLDGVSYSAYCEKYTDVFSRDEANGTQECCNLGKY